MESNPIAAPDRITLPQVNDIVPVLLSTISLAVPRGERGVLYPCTPAILNLSHVCRRPTRAPHSCRPPGRDGRHPAHASGRGFAQACISGIAHYVAGGAA